MSNQTTNTFLEGLMMDLNPLITPTNVLTSALNATLITHNGNENVLLNDMGNGRVETAFLPEGYIPVGTTELGGIIYIVSYNPIINKCLIGSFPSPERNHTEDTYEKLSQKLTVLKDFTEDNKIDREYPFKNKIKNSKRLLILYNKDIFPGDLFKIYSNDLSSIQNIISAYGLEDNNTELDPKYLKLNVISVQPDGTITNLNDTLVWNESGFYISQNENPNEKGEPLIDDYRKLVGGGYTPFVSKTSGRIGLLAQLEAISNFDCAWDAIQIDNKWNIFFHTNWEYDNNQSKDKINLYGIKVTLKYTSETSGNRITKDTYLILDEHKPNADVIEGENYNDATYWLGKIYPLMDDEGCYEGTTDILNDSSSNKTYLSPESLPYDEEGNLKDEIYTNPNYHQGGLLDGDTNVKRKNDGSDYLYLFPRGIELPDAETCVVEVCPVMPYGTLTYLKKEFIIEKSKLGTGDIELKEYRYFFQDESKKANGEVTPAKMTLNWGLEAYPERKKKIKKVVFNFYPYESNKRFILFNASWIDDNRLEFNSKGSLINNTLEIDLNQFPLSETTDRISITGQSSYSGNFINEITLTDKLLKYSLYLVEIVITYGTGSTTEKTIKYYRFMYTSDIFNSKYSNTNDFKDLILDKILFDPKNISYKLDLGTNNVVSTGELLLKYVLPWNETDNRPTSAPYWEDLSDSLIPYIKGETPIEEKYRVNSSFSFHTKASIKALSKFKGFNITLLPSSGNSIQITPDFTPTVKLSWLNLDHSIQLMKELDEVDYSIIKKTTDLNSFVAPYDTDNQISVNFYNPFILSYDSPATIAVPYSLQPISIYDLCIYTHHNDKGSSTVLRDGGVKGSTIATLGLAQNEYRHYTQIFKLEITLYLKDFDVIRLYLTTSSKVDGTKSVETHDGVPRNVYAGGECITEYSTNFSNFELLHDAVLGAALPADTNGAGKPNATKGYIIYAFNHINNNHWYASDTKDYSAYSARGNIKNWYLRKKISGDPIKGMKCSLYYYPEFVASLVFNLVGKQNFNPTVKIGSNTLEVNMTLPNNLKIDTQSIEGINSDSVSFVLSIVKYIQQLSSYDSSQLTEINGEAKILSDRDKIYQSNGLAATDFLFKYQIKDDKLYIVNSGLRDDKENAWFASYEDLNDGTHGSKTEEYQIWTLPIYLYLPGDLGSTGWGESYDFK